MKIGAVLKRTMQAVALLPFFFVAACGGGGGGDTPPAAPPAVLPVVPPVTPPPPGPSDPAVALARPVSAFLLCGNGLAKRYAATSRNQFQAVAASLGVTHWHHVEPGVWVSEPGAFEGAIRTGAVLAGNLNGDCWPDLAFTTGAAAAGQFAYYENRTGRRFAQALWNLPRPSNVVAGAGLADLNGDYRVDLAVGNLFAGSMALYAANPSGGFDLLQELATSKSTFGFAFGDYSGDGWLDVHAAHWDFVTRGGEAPALLRNGGAAGPLPPGAMLPADVEAGTAGVARDFNFSPGFADLNADRRADLLIASDFGTSEVLLNTGAQSFTVVTDGAVLTDENGTGAALQDFDNDGRWDWFVASVHGPEDGREWPWGRDGNRLYWGGGPPSYLTAASAGAGVADADWPFGVCAQDFDNDGLTDLFVENGYGFVPEPVVGLLDAAFAQRLDALLFDTMFTRARLFINRGDRTFVDRSAAWGIASASNGRGVACLDYDRDGDVDIAVAQNSGAPLVYENQSAGADGNNFIAIRLLSIAPNTFAVGAVVTVEAGGRTQMKQVGANVNFLGMDSTELHFGLSSATQIDAVTVLWPDGTLDRYPDLPANGYFALLHPRMIGYADPARLDDVAEAADSAGAYVAANRDSLPNDMLVLLTAVQRLHGLALPYSPAEELAARELRYQAEGELVVAASLRAYRRLYDPTFQVTAADYDLLQSFDQVTLQSVYCHQFPLDDGFVTDVGALTRGGGYDTTHALVALYWAADNGCALPDTFGPELLSETVLAAYAIADDAGRAAVTDLRVEAMAFLAGVGRHDLIRSSWVDQVLAAQRPDGSWAAVPGSAEPSSGHTTGLALWFLLQLLEDNKVLSGFLAQSWRP